jgi:hypothetical protein
MTSWWQPVPRVVFAVVVVLLLLLEVCTAQCPNDCTKHGTCSIYGDCACFSGYEGLDCSRRSCAKGPAFASVPNALDQAHEAIECSGQGTCDYSQGICNCYSGFSGHNCGRNACLQGCSGHGQCVSLGTAAVDNDGYALNRTTRYDLWDAERIFGCKCDYGFSGPDCSERRCQYGPDPRMASTSHESISLVCDCRTVGCAGKFKLRYFGVPIRTWLGPWSTAAELAVAITSSPGVFKDSTALTRSSVFVANRNDTDTLCADNELRETIVKFRRNAGDMPVLSFYANTMQRNVYLQVT